MKIKIVYGVDMRLWRYKLIDSKPPSSAYQDLLAYAVETFSFSDPKQFKITFKDDDDTHTTLLSQSDFEDAFYLAQKTDKKSLKLYITDTDTEDIKEQKCDPIPSQTQPQSQSQCNDASDSPMPNEEEINAFLSDDFTMDLLSDLFVSVFEALQASNFEISFIECLNGVLLSNDAKYHKLTQNKVWPYFMQTLLPRFGHKIEHWMVPMIKMNGINAGMVKQWIPTLLQMMKYQSQKGRHWGRHCGRGRRGRGRGGWGRHWRHGNGHRHGHRGHRGRGGHRWRGRGGFGCGNWQQWQRQNGEGCSNEEQIESEVFEYTEELVAVMNMGFGDVSRIKGLLNEHKGNKQLVVQELVNGK